MQGTSRKRRGFLRRWLPTLLLAPLLLLVILLLAGFAFLRTDYGLGQVENLANSVLSDVGGQSIALSGLHGRFPFELGLNTLRIADSEGTWLELDDLALGWSGRDLLAARVRVLELSASRLELLRTPEGQDTEPRKPRAPDAPFPELDLPSAFPRMALDSLEIPRVVLAPAVTGTRAVLHLRAQARADEHGALISLDVDSLQGLAGTNTLLALQAGLDTDTDQLTLDTRFADEGGTLAPLLGLPPATPLGLELHGAGPAASWEGQLNLHAGDLIQMDSDLALEWQDHPALTWDGNIQVDAALLPDPAEAYLPATSFSLRADMPDTGHLNLTRLTLDNAMLQAALQARLNLAKTRMQGQMDLSVAQTAPLNQLAGIELGPDITLHADFSGPFARPEIDLNLALRQMHAGTARIGTLALDSSIRFTAEAGDPASGTNDERVAVRGELRASGLDVPDTALPADLTTRFDLQYQLGADILRLTSLDIDGQDLSLRAAAEYGVEHARLEADLELRPTPIQPWLHPHGLDYAGQAGARLTAQGTVQPMQLDVDLRATLDHLGGWPDPLPTLLGQKIDLLARAELTPPQDPRQGGPGRIRLTSANIQALAVQLTANADFDLASQHLDAAMRLELPDLSQAVPHQKQDTEQVTERNSEQTSEPDLAGATVLEASARGHVSRNLTAQAVLHTENLTLGGAQPFPLRLELEAASLPHAPQGSVRLATSPLKADLDADLDFALKDTILELSRVRVSLPRGQLSGQARVDLQTSLATARLQGAIADIAPLAALAGQDMHAGLDIELDAQPLETDQQARLDLTLREVRADFGTLEQARIQSTLRANPQDLPSTLDMDADLELKAFQTGETRVDSLQAQISGSLSDLTLHAASRGTALHPFALNLRADYEQSGNQHIIVAQEISGTWADAPLNLANPVRVVQSGDDLDVSRLQLGLGQATVHAEGNLTAQEATLRLGVEDLPLKLFTNMVTGTVTMGVDLNGPKSGLHGQATLLGRQLAPADSVLTQAPALDLHVEASLDGQQAQVQAGLLPNAHSGTGGDAQLHATGQTALRLGLEPPGLDLPRDQPITAALHGDMDLGWLGDIFLPENQLIIGRLNLDFDLAGTAADPVPGGRIQLRDAGYQHLQQGVLLRDITGEALVDAQQVTLRSLTATDGAEGTLRITGEAEIDPDKDFPFQFDVNGETMRVLDSSMVRAGLESLNLQLRGTAKAQEVQGDVVLDKVEVFLRDFGGPKVAELDVVETKGGEEPASSAKTSEPAPDGTGPPMDLDIRVNFPNQVFVRGRGLDSEWKGRLHITGTAAAPEVRGDIKPQRGRLDVLGKRFMLKPESIIQFTGGQPPLPFVNVLAEQDARDYVFTVQVSGVPPDIKLELLSSPSLPDDEILSRMLFGESLARITPTQAAKLAMAARELAGGGSGMDLMGTARDMLGLDDLDVVTDEAGDMNLRAGTYVNDRVYLRLDSDLKTGEETVTADVELTRNINLESSVGSSGGGLGLFWKRDY